MNVDGWFDFKFSDLFVLKKGKRLTKADMLEGSINYVGATDSNNGITAKIGNDLYLHEKNTITVSYNGSIAEAFYQTEPFWATDDVNVLYPKFSINKWIALFLTTLIHNEKYRFNYGRKWDIKMMRNSKIKLPVKYNQKNDLILDKNDKPYPDWEFIETFQKKLKLPKRTKAVFDGKFNKESILNKKLSLKISEWKWFRYDEVFIIRKGFYNKKPDEVNNGSLPFIGATDSNNGITMYTDIETVDITSKTGDDNNAELKEKIFDGNCITVSNNGSVGYAFYQSEQFTCTHDVNPLYLRDHSLNVYIAMFLCTLIEKERYRWAYGRKWRPKRMPSSLIKLPAKKNADGSFAPDWCFMENYIKGLKYSSCL